CGPLPLVTKRARQVELITDARTMTLRAVDTLRTTIVQLSVVRKDRRDGIEWTSSESIVTRREEVEHLRIETVEQVADAAVELIVTTQTELRSSQVFKRQDVGVRSLELQLRVCVVLTVGSVLQPVAEKLRRDTQQPCDNRV